MAMNSCDSNSSSNVTMATTKTSSTASTSKIHWNRLLVPLLPLLLLVVSSVHYNNLSITNAKNVFLAATTTRSTTIALSVQPSSQSATSESSSLVASLSTAVYPSNHTFQQMNHHHQQQQKQQQQHQQLDNNVEEEDEHQQQDDDSISGSAEEDDVESQNYGTNHDGEKMYNDVNRDNAIVKLLGTGSYEGNSIDVPRGDITQNGNTINDDLIQLPLQYPFTVVQYGVPRTGSTFQFELLKAIMYLKSPPEEQEYYRMSKKQRRQSKAAHQRNRYTKVHGIAKVREFVARKKKRKKFVSIFISESGSSTNRTIGISQSDIIPNVRMVNLSSTTNARYSHDYRHNILIADITPSSNETNLKYHYVQYRQQLTNLYNCSLCEVDNYKDIFNLTAEDIALLKEYMTYYQDLRQCCGMQMSKYNNWRLHGCNVTEYQSLEQYPWCELKNMTHIEYEMHHHAIPHRPALFDRLLWMKPGDCRRFDEEIRRKNLGFNRRKFEGCPLG